MEDDVRVCPAAVLCQVDSIGIKVFSVRFGDLFPVDHGHVGKLLTKLPNGIVILELPVIRRGDPEDVPFSAVVDNGPEIVDRQSVVGPDPDDDGIAQGAVTASFFHDLHHGIVRAVLLGVKIPVRECVIKCPKRAEHHRITDPGDVHVSSIHFCGKGKGIAEIGSFRLLFFRVFFLMLFQQPSILFQLPLEFQHLLGMILCGMYVHTSQKDSIQKWNKKEDPGEVWGKVFPVERETDVH